jgi:phosphomannomutase
MIKLQQEGYNPMFAYEEAIGFMNGTEIRDKDGVSPREYSRRPIRRS